MPVFAQPQPPAELAETHRVCAQHGREPLPIKHFRGKRGQLVRVCDECRKKYGRWQTMSLAEKRALPRRPFHESGAYRAVLVPVSHNVKLGPIPTSMTGRGSCPDACSFKDAGCYAEYGITRMHWARTPVRGVSWEAFCDAVAALPEGQLWRHNTAGDLPGRSDAIDARALRRLVKANRGRRGFTFSHKPVLARQVKASLAARNGSAIARANADGFTVNLSADSLAHADELADLEVGPVAVVLPEGAPSRAPKTPAGRTVVVCPAQTAHLTCATCELCAKADRKCIVGFRAHGQSKALVTELVQLGRKAS
jgi:hypothetical protein